MEKNVSAKYSGKQVRCPICKEITKLAEEGTQMIEGEEDIIKFRCPSCNQKIGVPKDYAGRRVRCTKCKNPLEVPGASGQVKVEAEANGDDGLQTSEEDLLDGRSGMEALLSMEAGGEAVERPREEAPVEAEVEEKTWDATGKLIEPRGGTTQKKKNLLLMIVIGVGGVLSVLLIGWFFFGDRGVDDKPVSYDEVKIFAEDYIYLLSDERNSCLVWNYKIILMIVIRD
ncbi:MAG: zinc ribbon domain-containing protein [Planctomycetota bacterium]